MTATRWARILRSLGHSARIEQEYRRQRCDLLIALHARRSSASVERFRREHPASPLFLALTGTDLYGELHRSAEARRASELASRLILLQPLGVDELPPHLRAKACVIYQGAERPPGAFLPRRDAFEVCVIGHLRAVKDPFRAALAVRLLPPSSRIALLHLGAALSEEMAERARAEMARNPRYSWLGELPRWKVLRILARCRLLVLSSKMEGGANVISEAIAASVPILASRIPGSVGILGPDYPGFFAVGDTRALVGLLRRAESDPAFYATLKKRCGELAPLVDPARERQSWKVLLREVLPVSHDRPDIAAPRVPFSGR